MERSDEAIHFFRHIHASIIISERNDICEECWYPSLHLHSVIASVVWQSGIIIKNVYIHFAFFCKAIKEITHETICFEVWYFEVGKFI
jgi:hypothetical protein